jgi:predicted RND superfamily exporter protein
VAALAVFGFMGFARIYLDMSSATITTIAIGVGVDSAVHYLLQFRSDLLILLSQPGLGPPGAAPLLPLYREAVQVTTRRYGKTIVFDALSNILGFVPLLFSSFPVLEIAGLLLVLNQCLVLLATFFVTPTLILILKPDLPKGYRRARKSDELADELA